MLLPLRSIMSRVVVLHGVVVIAAAVLLRIVVHQSLDADVAKLQQSAMRALADSLGRRLMPTADGGWALNLPPGQRDQYSEAYGRYRFAIIGPDRGVLFSSRAAMEPLYETDRDAPAIVYFGTPTSEGQRTTSGVSVRRETPNGPLWIQVAEDLSHRDVIVDDLAEQLFKQLTWIIVFVLLLLLIADLVIFHFAVKPLRQASDLAKHISPTRIDVRLPTADIPQEILPLVVAVNQALDRLEQGFRSQRDFTADAAHELRTPLAILRTRIETLPENDAARVLSRDVESMSRVVSQLLDAAELETITVGRDEIADLHEICLEVVELIAPLALKQKKTIELTGVERAVLINGNGEMVRRAVRNLTENALYHTPRDTVVEVSVGDDGTVSVMDQGKGIAISERDLIFQRFWRRDQRGGGGAGLGLSIVRRIVDAHGGTVSVENRSTGGAKFVLRFRLLAEPQRGAA